MASTVTLAREIAYDAFVEVMSNHRKPEDVLEEAYAANEKALKRLDRNLVKEIVYGGLRWHSKIFWILQNSATRDLKKVSPQVQAALVLGTYQIYYMDRVPDRAAVNESAEYIRKKGQANAVSFVNGILRQIARKAEYFAKPDKKEKPVDYLALQYAFPAWMVERWLKQFKFDRLDTMLKATNQVPPWSVRVNTLKVPTDEIHLFQPRLLKEEKTHTEKRNLRGCLRLKEAPQLEPGSLFAQGFYTIQDEAAQLIAHLVDPKPEEVIVDAAAGPGGKFSHIFELSQGQANLIGVELKPSQMQRAKDTMNRLGHGDSKKIEWVEGDFLEWTPQKKVDKVLIDAPCSGLGVLRRHPEGKWHKDSNIIKAMETIQRRFIEHGLSLLKPGGELIYSVCSSEPEETEWQLDWVKKKFEDSIEVVSTVSRLPDYYKRYVTRENVLLVYAGNQDEMDGFGGFIIRLVKPPGQANGGKK